MKERRRFYRVDDSVIFKYRLVPTYQLEKTIARLEAIDSQHESMNDSLQTIESRLNHLLEEIDGPLPEIAEALCLINRKLSISMLSSHAENDHEGEEQDLGAFSNAQEVNLSASGLAFVSAEKISTSDTIIEIEFVLFPEYLNVKAIGKVVNCQKINPKEKSDETLYRVAMDFIHLKESDRETIISHVLLKQGRDLKKLRESEERATTTT